MKKKNIVNLIKYYSEKNDIGFKQEAYEIAQNFDKNGDYQLAEYIMALLSEANTFTPQVISEKESDFLTKIDSSNQTLPLPDAIKDDIVGIINAVGHNAGINKFLFQGAPGTGKTETAKQLARILDREIYIVNFDTIIDSKLGQTSKNIAFLFNEINSLKQPTKAIILFDEIDAIALDRTNSNDLREMGRATSSVLKGLDNLNEKVILVATTNLFSSFDKALVRRFDYVINFNRYTREDLIDIAEILVNGFINQFKFIGRNMRLLKKIINCMETIPYPGELKNLLKTSIAFSNPNDEFDYLKKLYNSIEPNYINHLKELQNKGFTVREIEILTNISKSKISRELKENLDE